jgi:NAD(P)-dependent dehydrogenase (short-subunit alcohol dehydrogenase family)
LVTGGASGIGAGIASVLASAGASVAIGDLNSPAAQHQGTGLAVRLDITDRNSVNQAVTEIELEYGPVDILVNNAGVSFNAEFLDITDRDWDRVMAVNLRGVLVVTQRVLPAMLRRQQGRIINIASVVGLEAKPLIAAYAASKSGVSALTQSFAKEVAKQDVTVNAVCPGIVRTPMWDDPDIGVLRQIGGEPSWQAVVADIPQGRPQTPEDIGHACAYLASDQAANITGIALSVSGGQLVR